MSAAYRENRAMRLPDPARTAAYLVTRMPATFAAAHAVLRELRERLGARPISSVLDMGAGAGAASLAARECFPASGAITMVERDAALAAAARQWLPEAAVMLEDVTRMKALPPHDLVIAAYSLGEIGGPLAARLWQAARVALVVIEPGTPRGYALILKVRAELLEAGGSHGGALPRRDPVPAGRARLVPFRGARGALVHPPPDQRCGAGLRGREVQLRRSSARAGGAARIAHHPAPAAAPGPDRAGNLRAGRCAIGARLAP